jgi:malonate transporter MadL subunit
MLGTLIGVEANVGGVGIAMLLLILLANWSGRGFQIGPMSSNGITFWSTMYIPIVVAMAAKQNVYAAVTGGPLALLAGALAVAGGYALIPLMMRLGAADKGGQSGTQR